MSAPETIDAEVQDVTDAVEVEPNLEAAALVTVETPAVAVTPAATAEDLSARLAVIEEAAAKAMKQNVDFGEIPGTNKPTLLKPGAEKLSVLFQLDIQIDNEKIFDGPHLTVVSKATAYHAPTGTRVGYGEGLCTTREKKYGKRTAKPVCPECDEMTVFRSKQEPGWFCWRKKGGCGANFGPDDQRISGQEVGEIENPDLPDTWNTVLKMAEKRARVDVVLAVTGASALFTQDVEDQVAARPEPTPEPSPEPPRSDWERLRVLAADVTAEQRGAIGGYIGFDGENESSINEFRMGQCIERLEHGDVDGLMTMIGGESGE